MPQMNINLTPDFERDLNRYMKKSGVETKSEAIRRAVREALEQLRSRRPVRSFAEMLGIAAKYPQNRSPRFRTEDDLWEKDGH